MKNKKYKYLEKLYWVVCIQFGINPIKLLQSMRGIPSFIKDWLEFSKKYDGTIFLKPCLYDRYENAGYIENEYFWQDLIVAREVFHRNPIKHLDIGSRIDGFVAHIASFRDCEVFDIRPIDKTIPGVKFSQVDLMNELSPSYTNGNIGYCDSISCLHSIEHFGLGRYGDSINPLGYEKGIDNISRLLKESGTCYLSTPIGIERVEFNANWVFNPIKIIRTCEKFNLELEEIIIVNPSSGSPRIVTQHEHITELSQQYYNLGIFILRKK